MSDETPLLANDRLLRAFARESVDATPVWLMRQAGRYLPEYRALREQAGSFLGLCTHPEMACEVTLQPLRRFALDAAILFSDILTIPKAMGLGLAFDDDGPHFARPIRSVAEIAALGVPDPVQELPFVMETVRRVRKELAGRVPLIGFAGAPWTLATYMVEGGGSRDFRRVKALIYEEPEAAHRLLEKLADAVTLYLNAQIAAGAQVVMLFDTWGGILTDHDYHTFALAAVRRAVRGITRVAEGRRVPVVLFTKGGALWLEAQAELGVDALGVDWTIDLAHARARVGGRVALQGNLDPAILAAPPECLKVEVARVLAAFGEGPGHVFNLGHGVTPDIRPEQVGLLVDTVHRLSARPAS